MTGRREQIPAEEVARVDQLAAQLREIVDAAGRHMAGCPSVPAGMCIGEDAEQRVRRLDCRGRFELLEEAVAQLARAAAPASAAEDGDR